MSILFVFPGNESLGASFLKKNPTIVGQMTLHRFPDGENLISIETPVAGQDCIILCTLDRPDEKATALMFMAETLRELGATAVQLIAPYLGYMRQDCRFHPGESITSVIFAKFISTYFDRLITIDPHLHRHKEMSEIYSIPAKVGHAAYKISDWIIENVTDPILIGPDEESDQWVKEVALKVGAPYTVMKKTRYSDTDVRIEIPNIEQYRAYTPVLVDDIISTGRTMIEMVEHLIQAGTKAPICIGVHAVFAGDAYQALKASGAGQIVTCNTIAHESNEIDISEILS